MTIWNFVHAETITDSHGEIEVYLILPRYDSSAEFRCRANSVDGAIDRWHAANQTGTHANVRFATERN